MLQLPRPTGEREAALLQAVGSEVKHDKLGCTLVAISFLVVAENREHIVAHPLIGGSILKGKEEDLNKLMCQGKLLHRRSVICIEEDTQVLGCDTMLLQRGLILNGKAEIPMDTLKRDWKLISS